MILKEFVELCDDKAELYISSVDGVNCICNKAGALTGMVQKSSGNRQVLKIETTIIERPVEWNVDTLVKKPAIKILTS